MKKLLTILIFAVLCGGNAMAYDFSAVCESGQTLYYNITSNVEPYTVSVDCKEEEGGYYSDYAGDIVIPETVSYNGTTYLVNAIGGYAFTCCTGLTSISIPNTVKYICGSAFSYCSGLTSITIPESVENIYGHAFAYCTGINSFSIPESVIHIEGTSLRGTGWYNNQPNGVLYLDSWCLGYKGSLNGHLTIEQGTKKIAIHAFEGCTGITSVDIPNSVKYLSGFDECSGLTSIDIPNSVETIGAEAFSYDRGITSITIPNSVRTIEEYAFGNCTALSCLNYNATNCIDMNVTYGSLGVAFAGCTALTTINIGDNVQTIPEGSFYGCDSLTRVNFNATNCTYLGGCWPYVWDVDSYESYNNTITTINIGSNVTNIPNYAFSDCRALTSVTIPSSVTSIGRNAFSGCTNLFTLNFNATNCTILFDDNEYNDYDGQYAFGNCPNLATINIGDNVQTIPEYAFPRCTGLTSVTIPNSVTSIGNYAFSGCSGLTEVTIGNSVVNIGFSAFSGCSSLSGTLVIPNSVTNIDARAFEYCSGLTSVTIPSSVTSIGHTAFLGCRGLTEVIIPNSITRIEGSTFSRCSGLTSVTIPNSVTSIGGYAFRDCTGLTAITIPNSVTNIGERAFCGCSGVGTIIVESGNLIYDSRNNCNAIIETSSNNLLFGCKNTIIPDSVITIGESAFEGCRELIGELTIPNSVTSIGVDAFYYCSGLTSVFIGNSVRTIGPGAFWGCTNLTEIYLGNSVETIGGGAFWCVDAHFKSSTGTIYALGETPPTLSHGEDYEGLGVFPEEPYSENCFRRLVVCCGNRGAYEASDWAHYFDNIEEDCNRYSISSNSNTVQGGSFNISSAEASMGEEVLVYVTVDAGYEIDHITAFNADNPNEIVPMSRIGNRRVITYSMTMPAFAVRIEVGFREGSGIENNELVELSIFPNPTTDILNIKSSETISEIEIVNVMGQVVKRMVVNADNAVCDVEDLNAGVYIVRIHAASATLSLRKFVKE